LGWSFKRVYQKSGGDMFIKPVSKDRTMKRSTCKVLLWIGIVWLIIELLIFTGFILLGAYFWSGFIYLFGGIDNSASIPIGQSFGITTVLMILGTFGYFAIFGIPAFILFIIAIAKWNSEPNTSSKTAKTNKSVPVRKAKVANWLKILSWLFIAYDVAHTWYSYYMKGSTGLFAFIWAISESIWSIIWGLLSIWCGFKCAKWATRIKKSPDWAYAIGFLFGLLGLLGYWIYYKGKTKK
jgi:hypothetical protein